MRFFLLNYLLLMLLTSLGCDAKNVFSSIPYVRRADNKTSFIAEEGLLNILNSDCVKPIGIKTTLDLKWINECLVEPGNSADKSILTGIPKRIMDWGSNGLGGNPWIFNKSSCNEFFIRLHEHIVNNIPQIRITPHDLFHAHLILYGQNKVQRDRMAIVFHAKEYPDDLEPYKNIYQAAKEKFNSTDPSFAERNFLYLTHAAGAKITNVDGGEYTFINDIYLLNKKGSCKDLFTDNMYNIELNTLDEKKVQDKLLNAIEAGDVNLFKKSNVSRLKFNFSEEENNNTKKIMPSKRLVINQVIDNWLGKWSEENILFFLTDLH